MDFTGAGGDGDGIRLRGVERWHFAWQCDGVSRRLLLYPDHFIDFSGFYSQLTSHPVVLARHGDGEAWVVSLLVVNTYRGHQKCQQ